MATINGTSGSDLIVGTSGSDTISAGDGSDTVYAGGGGDTISAGDGNDTVYGEGGNDTINGGDGNDTVYGGGGDDTLIGTSGNDKLYGDDGNDVIDGGKGNDNVYGGAGNDRVLISADTDTVDGGDGIDVLDGSQLNASITVDLSTGTFRASNGSFVLGVENVVGTRFNDTITGDAGDNVLNGNGGNDVVSGGAGNDTLIANSGNSTYYGGIGADTFVFTAGTTGTQVFDGGTGSDTVQLVLTSAQLTPAMVAELVAFSAFAANPLNLGLPFHFSAVGNLTATGSDTLSLIVDGQAANLSDLLNHTPTIDPASNSSLSVAHNHAANGAVIATDADGDTLSYSVQANAAHGSVALNAATGQYVYSAGDYVGSDSFTVRVSDGQGGYADHNVSVGLTNTGPTFDPSSTSSLSVGHGKSVAGLVGATDADGDDYSFSISTGPQHGTLVFTDANGSYVYRADDYVGSDSFTVRVSDGHGGFADHTVSVDATNVGPVINTATSMASFSSLYGQSVSGNVYATDGDGDGVSFALKSGPAHGSVHVDANGHFTFNAVDAIGTDSFVVTASDGHGGSADHTINFGVIGTLDSSAAATAVSVNIGAGTATGVEPGKLAWAINLVGSMFNDILYGDSRANILNGGSGKDELHGAAGHDRLDGGLGDDKLFGEDGNDDLSGGDGNDSFNGGAGNDVMRGDLGNDGFFGGGGDDRVMGGDGNDRVYGDGGNDFIAGGRGDDIMTGGGMSASSARGLNTFLWDRADVVNANGTKAGYDHITDFGAGDKLDFTGLVSSHPAAAHDMVRVTDTASGLVVSVDVGGTTGFVDVVVLDNVHGLTVDDLDHNGAIVI